MSKYIYVFENRGYVFIYHYLVYNLGGLRHIPLSEYGIDDSGINSGNDSSNKTKPKIHFEIGRAHV